MTPPWNRTTANAEKKVRSARFPIRVLAAPRAGYRDQRRLCKKLLSTRREETSGTGLMKSIDSSLTLTGDVWSAATGARLAHPKPSGERLQ